MKYLIITKTHWNEPPRVRHQVAQTLAIKNEVKFVAANKIGFPKLTVEKINSNLTLITPFFPIDVRIRYRFPIVNEIYQIWLFRKLLKSSKKDVVINFDFTANLLYKFFNKYIYYCHDNFAAISKHINPRFISRYHEKCEAIVAKKAVFCVSVIKPLQDYLKRYNQNSFEILLGSPDISEYHIKINYKQENKGKIQVGLVGFIEFYNTSSVLVNKILENNDFTLTIVGPVDPKFLDHLKNKENLVLTGPLTGKMLFEKINSFDVCIAPYNKNLLNDVYLGTGNKFYQYFTLGKPIVFAPVIGMEKSNLPPGFVYIAENENDFPDKIYTAVKENSKELIEQRIQYAKDNNWNNRIEKLVEYCNEYHL